MARWLRFCRSRISRGRVLALSGFLLSAVGSCTLPQIKPPSIP